MNLISNILLVSVPPIITGIAVYLNQKKSQINRNTETITDFNANLTTNISELEKNIGRENNDKSLTGQHSDISNLLEKEIATISCLLKGYWIQKYNKGKDIGNELFLNTKNNKLHIKRS